MGQLIAEIWEGLRSAGIPEVMLYLPDQSACRCHWKDTALIGDVRVALLADQDRQIVRILPVDSCAGIGVASPKGVDPSGYKTVVHQKLRSRFGGDEVTPEADAAPEPDGENQPRAVEEPGTTQPPAYSQPVAAAPEAPSEPPPEPESAARPDTLASRWRVATRVPERRASGSGGTSSGSFPGMRRL